MADGEFVTIAKVVKAQGRRGEVAVELFTDFPEKFEDRRRLLAWFEGKERRELVLEEFWSHKGQMILKFEGVDSINDAEELKGAEIQIPRAERAELDEGAIYIDELVGCVVSAASGEGESREIGSVRDVIFGAGEAPLLVVKAEGKGSPEHLIPLVESFLVKTDTAAKLIEMKLPQGLLEIDAPLSEEDKDAQRRGDQ